MAKKSTPKAVALGKQPREDTGPSRPVFVPLTLEERTELRRIYASATYRKAFTNARTMKPSAFGGDTDGALGGAVSAKKLHLIQGWELFEAAMLLQTADPRPPRTALEEGYPDDPFFASAAPDQRPAPTKPKKP